MTPEGVMQIGQEAIKTILYVAGPMLGLSLVVGLLVSAFQAMTQINEMTLSFIPKLLVTFVILAIGGPWILQTLIDFMTRMLEEIPDLIG